MMSAAPNWRELGGDLCLVVVRLADAALALDGDPQEELVGAQRRHVAALLMRAHVENEIAVAVAGEDDDRILGRMKRHIVGDLAVTGDGRRRNEDETVAEGRRAGEEGGALR